MTWAQDQRIAYIKQQIEAGEGVTRPDVAARFNCTIQTVTATFHECKRRYPDLMAYDEKAKAYRRAELVRGVSGLSWKERALAAEAKVETLQTEFDGYKADQRSVDDFHIEKIAELQVSVETLTRERDEALEALARQIYDAWKTIPGWVPWVERGNSQKQEFARQKARELLQPSRPSTDTLAAAFAEHQRRMVEETIPAIEDDLRQQARVAAKLRLGQPIEQIAERSAELQAAQSRIEALEKGLESLTIAENHRITSGSPGPLYTAGWNEAFAAVATFAGALLSTHQGKDEGR